MGNRYLVDVVAIKVDDLEEVEKQCEFNVLNDYNDFETKFDASAMDDVFVIGYPWGLTGGSEALPLYKRGSIASEPQVPYSNLPRMLIDCRTTKSMSGAPVIVSHSGIWHPDGKPSANTIHGTVTNFIGVYSGRLYSNEIPDHLAGADISEIGIVWKKEALDEVVNNGAQGVSLDEIVS